MSTRNPMTIGQLSKATGVSIKTLREYEGLGLLYTLGRSEGNYRLFDESALWCVRVVSTLRSLGLTLKEMQEIATFYLEHPDQPVGPLVREHLERVLRRVDTRMTDLGTVRQRIQQAMSGESVVAHAEGPLGGIGPDPHRSSR